MSSRPGMACAPDPRILIGMSSPEPISVYDLDAVQAWARRHGITEAATRRFRIAFFKKGAGLEDCVATLPASVREEFSRSVRLSFLDLAERHDSRVDGASKLIFRTADGLRLETVVLRIASGRTSLCISSQVGCAAGCAFCATGKLGLLRNLTRDEMLDQVIQSMRLVQAEGRTIRNVVMMGMGEPFHNEEAVYATLDLLRDARGCHLSDRHLLVSTVGMADAMVRFVEAFPQVRLALSLHSARQDVRRELMPSARSQRLDKLQAVLPDLARHGNFMIEYLMLKGVNDQPEDLAALVELLAGLPVHINLIQFNPHPGSDFQPVEPAHREAFGRALRAAGFKVTLRYSLGQDIDAACGQLAGR